MSATVAFLGNDQWSVPSLRALAAAPAFDVTRVFTNPPAPAGRGAKLTPTAVARAARELGLLLVETDGVKAGRGRSELLASKPDVVVVVAYGELLPPDILAASPWGAVNLHLSLLPRWRGAAPVMRAIMEGDRLSGVTVMAIDAGLDTGPILSQIEEPIRDEDDAGSLGARLSTSGARLLVATLQDVVDGRVMPRPQTSDDVTYAPKPAAAERWIDWQEPAEVIVRRIRAFAPDPGARTKVLDTSLKILEAGSVEGSGPAGTVLSTGAGGVVVGAMAGAVHLRTVTPAGRRRMSAEAWARGARLRPGERLG